MQLQHPNCVLSRPPGAQLRHPPPAARYHAVVCASARAGGNGTENGKASAEKQREIAKMLLATQKNMLELNNSRVKVQEELATANRRIADLERELERMRAEHARQQLTAQMAKTTEAVLPPPFSQDRGVAVATPATPPQQQQQQQPQQQYQQQQQQYQQQQAPPHQQQQQQMEAAAPPPMQQAPQQPAVPGVIHLTYISGWHNCFVHYSVDGKPWTSTPGQRMTTSKRDHATKTIAIEGTKMEFVMTNGENDWDSPGRYQDKPKNYAIERPGHYRLKSGKLEAVPEPPAEA